MADGFVLGIDPGATGALALVDERGVIEDLWDMPVRKERGRKRTDPVELRNLVYRIQALYDPEAWIIEAVGGRPAQSASAAFVFGVGYGMIVMLGIEHKVRLDFVEPGIWKRAMRAPADKQEAVNRADELFPAHRNLFRGRMGGLRPDRAEAAMLALYKLEKMR